MKELEDTKVAIIRDENTVFYSALMCNMEVFYSDEVPTAATNGLAIMINEAWFLNLSPAERVGLMLHEICHTAYLHPLRMDERDHKLWNQATDYAINIDLQDSGFTLPAGGCVSKEYRGMSAEEIYAILEQKQEDGEEPEPNVLDGDLQPPPSDGGDGDQDDDGEGDQDSKGMGSSDGSLVEQKITEMVVAAAQQAEILNAAGSIPANIKRQIEELLDPKLPWEVLLDRYKDAKAKEDYSWARRNRRYQDIYLPSLYSDSMGTLAVYVDASCSVPQQELNQYVAEIVDMKGVLDPELLEVISFDTQIYDIQTIVKGESPNIHIQGGGGTDLTEVAERINEENADVNIVFTDGYYQPVTYNKEVLHIIVGNKDYTNNQENPVIHLEL